MLDKTLALYIRLSDDDDDIDSHEKKESYSITNQRELLMAYYRKHPDLAIYKVEEFCDDGFTGTNFDRPQFHRMMEGVRAKTVHAILVKDLSRFGRDYLEVSGYLELVLPIFGTRFISVNDHFDSFDYVGTTGGMELALRNLINGMYSKDLSMKLRSSYQTRSKRGEFLGGQAFYGYKMDPNHKKKIIVDENVRHIVEMIFQMCIDGSTTRQIASYLNDHEIPSPTEYKKLNGMYYNGTVLEKKSIWLGSTIRKILADERYTGKMISGTRQRFGIRGTKSQAVPRNQWIIVEGTHEPIISDETFQKASAALASRIRTVNQNTAGVRSENLFVCGYCGRKLSKSQGKNVYLYCLKASSFSGTECENIRENMATLQSKTLTILQALSTLILNKADFIRKNGASEKSSLQKEKDRLEKRRRQLSNGKRALYEEYRDGHISRERFLKSQAENAIEDETLKEKILSIQNQLEKSLADEALLQSVGKDVEQIQALTTYEPNVVKRLVESIRVYPNERIEIQLRNQGLAQFLQTDKQQALPKQ